MSKSVIPSVNAPATPATPAARQPRPFLFLEPQVTTSAPTFSAEDVRQLDECVADNASAIVRSLVNYTIALQNRRALEHGDVKPIQLSVLNRRRRAARAWIVAIVQGKIDSATRHAVSSQWLPTLCATGPDRENCAAPASQLVEFMRGAVTACIFDGPAENLVPHARALHVLESVLAVHLTAVREAARASSLRD